MAFALYAEERSTATVPGLIAVTARFAVMVCDKPPDIPVIVMVELPGFDASFAVSVMLFALPPLAGLNEAATPGGRPDTRKRMLARKLPRGVKAIVVEVVLPLRTEKPAAGVWIAKSSAPGLGGASRS